MTNRKNRQFLLAARPEGEARIDHFELVTSELPALKDGEVLFRNTLISLDPYQRNLMGNGSSELPPIDVGTPMQGPTIAVIEESRNPDFAVGDIVQTWSGWQDYAISTGIELRKLDANAAPVSTALGVLGHTGLTAWVGMTRFLNLEPGQTLVITAAAGSVGSLAAQIGKLRGLRVVGIAGGPAKTAFLRDELGLDAAVDYKAADFKAQLQRALPDGIDGLYDNVGDYMFEALMDAFNPRAQIVIGGTIAGYSETEMPARGDHLPRLLNLFLYRFLQVQGFSVIDHMGSYPEFLAEVGPWVAAGKVKYAEEFVDGFERIPETFLRLFTGQHDGKLMVRLG